MIPLIHGVKKLVLVGDQKQLGPVVPNDDNNIFRKLKFNRSIYERIIEGGYSDYFFLDTQFRMHPHISAYPNEQFYQNRIRNDDSCEVRDLKLFPNHFNFIEIEDGKEEKDGTSYYNLKEIEVVKTIAMRLYRSGVDPKQVGIITPYASQALKMRKEINSAIMRYKISTVDSFQGSEKEYIIVSTTRTGDNLGFLRDKKRLNVTVTRAKNALIVVGSSKALYNDDDWREMVRYAKANRYYLTKIPEVSKQKAGFKIIIPGRTQSREFEEETNFNGVSGLSENSVESSVSKSNVKIFWPNNETHLKQLKVWVDAKLNILKRGGNVTLAYDAESVCIQLGDVFGNKFDYYNYNKGNTIPPIRKDDGIIVFYYENVSKYKENNKAINVLKPLLEHPKITLLTFDFTMDLELLLKFGINVKTSRIIDAQMLTVGEISDSDDLIVRANNSSLKHIIGSMRNSDKMSEAAIRAIESNEKRFPFDANNFLCMYENNIKRF